MMSTPAGTTSPGSNSTSARVSRAITEMLGESYGMIKGLRKWKMLPGTDGQSLSVSLMIISK